MRTRARARLERITERVFHRLDAVFGLVGGGGFEPPTSSVSGKRSPPELTARARVHRIAAQVESARRVLRRGPELNRCARFCRPLPNHSATPPESRQRRRDPC